MCPELKGHARLHDADDAAGLPGTEHTSASGRPAGLTCAEQQTLRRLPRRGALASGFATDRWTMGRVRQLIERELSVDSHANSINRLLVRLGWSLRQPLPRGRERDEELIRAGLAHDWPRIKIARRRGVNIVSFAEFGYSFLERLWRTWAPRGKRPSVRRVTRDQRALTTAVGLTLSGKVYQRYFGGGMDSDDIITAFEHLRRFMPEGFILILDQAPLHPSEATIRYLWDHPEIVVEPLSPCAPEINPEESCHGHLKHRLANASPEVRTQLRRFLDCGFARLRRRPDLLLSFVQTAGLPVRCQGSRHREQ